MSWIFENFLMSSEKLNSRPSFGIFIVGQDYLQDRDKYNKYNEKIKVCLGLNATCFILASSIFYRWIMNGSL